MRAKPGRGAAHPNKKLTRRAGVPGAARGSRVCQRRLAISGSPGAGTLPGGTIRIVHRGNWRVCGAGASKITTQTGRRGTRQKAAGRRRYVDVPAVRPARDAGATAARPQHGRSDRRLPGSRTELTLSLRSSPLRPQSLFWQTGGGGWYAGACTKPLDFPGDQRSGGDPAARKLRREDSWPDGLLRTDRFAPASAQKESVQHGSSGQGEKRKEQAGPG